MIGEVLLVHHSHTDIGYTHPQPVIYELHRRFIDQALDCAEATRDAPDGCRFKWTCEVTGVTVDWWQRASAIDRRRFRDAIDRGQIEVAGLGWNITPLLDDQALLRLLEPITFLRSIGIPVTAAMNSDVNGVPWGLVDALIDYGIDAFSMGVNEHYGYAPQPRPRGFWWESPTGKKILVWNGLQYWNAANIQMRIPESREAVQQAMPKFLSILEARGYPYAFLPVQITTASAPDNASPDPGLPAFVRDWNRSEPTVRLRLVTLSEVFARLRQETLPTQSGDWTDWWNFGSGSTARETTLALEGQRLLGAAHQLRAWPGQAFPREQSQFDEAQRALALYTEHTWGADRSVYQPDSIETEVQLNQKLSFAYEGYILSRMLRRDGLEKLARIAGGDDLTALFYNPLPFPVRRMLRVPVPDGEFSYLSAPFIHLHHRMDTALSDLPAPTPDGGPSQWIGPIEIPAFGYTTRPYPIPAPSSEGLTADPGGIGNGRIEVRFAPNRAGIAALSLDGIVYSQSSAERLFAEPVLERPAEGTRGALFGPLNWRELDVHQQWHGDWKAVYEGPVRLLSSRHAVLPGCAEFEQSLDMPTGDHLTLTYRVFRDEPGVELTVVVKKVALEEPHALYLPLPLEIPRDELECHFATAGAVVALDQEQLPFASRHYVTTQRFIRMQGRTQGLTIACPDAPLWQVGGYTFGRHDTDGRIATREPMLAAWLTNNYWDVNFAARQSGQLRFRFRLLPHPAQPVETSVRQALVYAEEPQLHIYRQRGEAGPPSGQLLDTDLGDAVLTGLEGDEQELRITLLNPADTPQPVRIASGIFRIGAAMQTTLAGIMTRALPVASAATKCVLPPRTWSTIRLRATVQKSV